MAEAGLFALLPVWVTLIVLLMTVIVSGLFLMQRARGAEEAKQNKHLQDQIAKLNERRKAEITEKPQPTLHASWRADSVWGWASAFFKEDPIYIVRGDVTLLMDNIPGPVIITGIEIEGAEPVGNFDNFQLHPNQPLTRGMRVYFRGMAPEGTDDYTVRLVFRDLRGKSVSDRGRTDSNRFRLWRESILNVGSI